ncbi:MAG TPA: nickel pincer cofactor biosynthesis protein LarB [Bacteroidetes bacterium]|nr:nickel pincer cofactor biosynthesis protein LarB [Bacteroidota bacterium]
MNREMLEELLNRFRIGTLSREELMETLRRLPYADLGYAKVDHHRELRVGFPEVIFCTGKTIDQVKGIFTEMQLRGSNILATRATYDMFGIIKENIPEAEYFEQARIIRLVQKEMPSPETSIAVISAGTSDMPVAEEAAITAETFGNRVERIYDVGVAGIHRLFDRMDLIGKARVIVVVAGMEGALASVVGGLVDKPVIAVPTSIGYGASFGGLSALLGMLTSCASGVTVVNIDNGFGAGYTASLINRL